MKDHRKFDLRMLTENIYYIREYLLNKKSDASKHQHDEIKELYEELWKRRDELEDDIFGSNK